MADLHECMMHPWTRIVAGPLTQRHGLDPVGDVLVALGLIVAELRARWFTYDIAPLG